MSKDILNQIEELTAAINQKREAIDSMCEGLKYADNIAYSRDREAIKSARLLLKSMLDELEELKNEAGIAFVQEKKAHTIKAFIYEKLKPYSESNRFFIVASELDQNFTDSQEMVFVGTTEFTAMLNTIDKEQEYQQINHRDEMRMRFELEEKIKARNFNHFDLDKKAS